MVVRLKLGALKQGTPREYFVRFCLGGAMAVVAGIIADVGGPAVGGLFLAFPAIFAASATLIDKHERERKAQKGLAGVQRVDEEQQPWTPPAPAGGAWVSLPSPR
jgi:hypothetical protein